VFPLTKALCICNAILRIGAKQAQGPDSAGLGLGTTACARTRWRALMQQASAVSSRRGPGHPISHQIALAFKARAQGRPCSLRRQPSYRPAQGASARGRHARPLCLCIAHAALCARATSANSVPMIKTARTCPRQPAAGTRMSGPQASNTAPHPTAARSSSGSGALHGRQSFCKIGGSLSVPDTARTNIERKHNPFNVRARSGARRFTAAETSHARIRSGCEQQEPLVAAPPRRTAQSCFAVECASLAQI